MCQVRPMRKRHKISLARLPVSQNAGQRRKLENIVFGGNIRLNGPQNQGHH